MKTSKYIRFIFPTLFLLASTMFSCLEEENSPTIITPRNNVVFELTENDENKITTIDVLAFKVDPNDETKETFEYRTEGKNITDDGAPNKKKFTVSILKGGTNKYRFVVLANAKKQLDALGDINTTALKPEILKRLVSTHQGIWNTNTNAPDYESMPMWAESEQLVADNNLETIAGLHLVRMLARVDVGIDAAILSTFKLKSIRVYNYNTNGYIVPDTDPLSWDGTVVLRPTIPSPSGNTLGPLVYDQLSTADVALIRGIYLYEVARVPSNEAEKATCLVIGGVYKDDGKETFYRLDFVGTVGNQANTYLNILRNNLYNFKINNVGGRGYDTPEEAFNSKAVNIEVDITVWSQGGLSTVVFDDQYVLGISQSSFSLPLNAVTKPSKYNQLKIATDYPAGWVIDKITDINNNPITWLDVDVKSGPSNDDVATNLLTQENDTEVDRYGYIHIKAGRLTFVVEVLQTTIPELYLTVTDEKNQNLDGLLFGSFVGGTVPAQKVLVQWGPSSANPLVNLLPLVGTKLFDFGTGDKINPGYILTGTGERIYNIQPPAMTQAEIDADPFLEKTSKIDITVGNNVSYVSNTFFLTQKNYAAVPNVDANIVLDGSEQYLTINANAPWEIEVVTDVNSAIQQLVTVRGGQYEDKRTEKIYFRTNNLTSNSSITTTDVTFRLKSTNLGRPFPDKLFTVTCYSGAILPTSNSYIIPPYTTTPRSYLIPVSRANEALPSSIGEEDKLDAELVWTDNSNVIATNGNIANILPVGRGRSGYLYILPGSAQGNSVVAAKVGAIIKWSWHIWSTIYDPSTQFATLGTYTIMNRNLGATTNTVNQPTTLGLSYQWGRKDPFPRSTTTTGTITQTIYNAQGVVVVKPVSGGGNLNTSVANPLDFYTSSGWLGSNSGNSWGATGGKSLFDPCPPGWRVPLTATFSVLTVANAPWANNGRTHPSGGYFPAAGLRDRSNASLSSVGALGGYWSGSYNSPFTPTLQFNSTSLTTNINYVLDVGASIRCVKE